MSWLNLDIVPGVLSPSSYSDVQEVLYNIPDFVELGSAIHIYDRNYAEKKHLPMKGGQGVLFIPKSSQDKETILFWSTLTGLIIKSCIMYSNGTYTDLNSTLGLTGLK